MSYQLKYTGEARRDVRDMPAHLRSRAKSIIEALQQEQHPPRSKRLRDPLHHLHQMPLEDWRIIYEIDDEEQLITIVRVKPKRGPETYEDLT